MEQSLASSVAARDASRIAWVDYGKGLCIILVVMMHSTLGVEAAFGQQGWLHAAVEFVRPFRIPAFFLISGLFVARVIDRDWRGYLDSKVVHFVYFYLLWLTIQFVFKAPALAVEKGAVAAAMLYLEGLVEPFGTLWFIYLLPIFFVVTKLTRRVPPAAVWAVAAALELLPIETSSTIVNEFASRFVYFYTGYIAARGVFALASAAQADIPLAVIGLLVWAPLHTLILLLGSADRPVFSLALGMIGCAALIAVAALLAKRDLLPPLRYCGQNSIVIYLAFFLPMAITRVFFLKTHLIADVGTVSLIVTLASIAVPLALYRLVRNTPLRFLFERPARFRIKAAAERTSLQPAE
jgi:uncharacterized membrane protein YcfT